MKMHTKSTLFASKINKLQRTLDIEVNTAEGEFVPQMPMRNQLFTRMIKRGQQRNLKSGLARGLRTDNYRYIEAARFVSYRFLSIGRLLRRFFGLKWEDGETCNAKNVPKRNRTTRSPDPSPCFGAKTVPRGSRNAFQNGCKSKKIEATINIKDR